MRGTKVVDFGYGWRYIDTDEPYTPEYHHVEHKFFSSKKKAKDYIKQNNLEGIADFAPADGPVCTTGAEVCFGKMKGYRLFGLRKKTDRPVYFKVPSND
jgi:hypothetical protein